MTILRLNSADDERLALYRGLTNHQLRNVLDPARAVAVVESPIAVCTALDCGAEPLSFLLDERRFDALANVLERYPEAPVFVLPSEEAQRLTGYRVTRGALCAVRRPAPLDIGELVAGAHRLVVLESITDASNVGAIARNAVALGADALVVDRGCADPLSRRAIRVSMGNIFRLPWARSTSSWPQGLIMLLEEAGFACIALALTPDARDIRMVAPEVAGRRTALFFGTEGEGLSDAVLARCHKHAVIPMHTGVDSLNVAASSAVALWELYRGE